jgi:hypothetical protein
MRSKVSCRRLDWSHEPLLLQTQPKKEIMMDHMIWHGNSYDWRTWHGVHIVSRAILWRSDLASLALTNQGNLHRLPRMLRAVAKVAFEHSRRGKQSHFSCLHPRRKRRDVSLLSAIILCDRSVRLWDAVLRVSFERAISIWPISWGTIISRLYRMHIKQVWDVKQASFSVERHV